VRDREELYRVINNRTDIMIQNNWKEEVETLFLKYPNINELNSFRAIGYDIVLNSIVNKTNIDIEKIKQKTRNLAKKQLTWINNKTKVDIKFNIDKDNINLIIDKVNEFVKRK
jgi:tRNA dimethylallyltransferase